MPKFFKENLDRFFDYDVDLTSRTMYLGSINADENGESGVDCSMAERAIKALHILDSLYPDGDKPITVIMNNPGGDVIHGMAIYDFIKGCRNHVTIKVYGQAMSMGSIILQAADQRLLSPNSKVMIHYGTVGFDHMHAKDAERWMRASKIDDAETEQLYLARIKEKHPEYTLKKVKDLLMFDTILNAREAVDLGLADGIIGEEE